MTSKLHLTAEENSGDWDVTVHMKTEKHEISFSWFVDMLYISYGRVGYTISPELTHELDAADWEELQSELTGAIQDLINVMYTYLDAT